MRVDASPLDPDEVTAVARAMARAQDMEWDVFPDDDADGCVWRRDARAAITAIDEFRARSAESAEPRPFQVGDVVHVAEDATYSTGAGATSASYGRGEEATVMGAADEYGDYWIRVARGGDTNAHHNFLTLVALAAKP